MNENQLSAITSQEEADHIAQLGQALERLKDNPDFKVLFEKHIMTNEALRLSSVLGSPALNGLGGGGIDRSAKQKENVIADLEAISRLKEMLRIVSLRYAQLKELAEAEETE